MVGREERDKPEKKFFFFFLPIYHFDIRAEVIITCLAFCIVLVIVWSWAGSTKFGQWGRNVLIMLREYWVNCLKSHTNKTTND